MTKILICGDSFAVTDPAYPGLSWTEKILDFSPDFEVINLAYGGCSNALIALQLSQGLRFDPDFVIFTFTSPDRFEFDSDIDAMPVSLSPAEIASYLKRRYTTNMYDQASKKTRSAIVYQLETASQNLETLKNYFYIMYCLNEVKNRQINFCYSLGGFEFQHDYNGLLNRNFLSNSLVDYKNQELLTNLWDYKNHSTPAYFHVDDPKIQTLFANQCIEHITNTGCNSN
jgi:hypothetical protein